MPGKHVYRGQFVKGTRSGNGKIEWNSGEWYEGNFEDDVPHGKGQCAAKEKLGICTFEKGDLLEVVSGAIEAAATQA